MSLDKATKYDPRGLIAESYHIENISEDEAKSIFMDWAISDLKDAPEVAMRELWVLYGEDAPTHPMSKLLMQGLTKPARKGGRRR